MAAYEKIVMKFLPFDRMWERVEIAKGDSDTSVFFQLMYFGEMLVKITVAGLVAAIDDDRERNRYRQIHKLVRADGIGEWSQVADEVLLGPPAQHLFIEARDVQRELTQKLGVGTWQYDSVTLLFNCIEVVEPDIEPLPNKIDARRWLELFARLRNKTRGHGAAPTHVYSEMVPMLEEAIRLFCENLSMFGWPWAYLHQNLSGKYRVTAYNEAAQKFNYLKSKANFNSPDGVFIHLEKPTPVNLIHSNVDASDFLFPNGAFNDKSYELLSYITGVTSSMESLKWLAPANLLPQSETQGLHLLDAKGQCFNNLPSNPSDYVHRIDLEGELKKRLVDERHPIITLVGRGGIGKTSLALTVLHDLAHESNFKTIIWFSARDVDLLPHGPKIVQPHILSEREIAKELVRLAEPEGHKAKGFNPTDFLAQTLQNGLIGPALFVFDNFETVKSPGELYSWIDTYIRLPNKILITTRSRDFKGDFPVDVFGMSEDECSDLIDVSSRRLYIEKLISDDYKLELYKESDGHPYVIKVLLGEVAKAGQLVKVERIVAGKDEILTALFERTYNSLSVAARRIFLTLCNWRSTIPQLALEAVLLRPGVDKMDVRAAVEELSQSSFIEVEESSQDRELFISVPLVASVFGQRKLSVSPLKGAVEADTPLLQAFGASQKSDIRHGIAPRVERLFHIVAKRIGEGKNASQKFAEYLPILEFVARQSPPAWLLLASLHEEFDTSSQLVNAKAAILRYLESAEDNQRKAEGWSRLAALHRQTRDWLGEIHALLEAGEIWGTPFYVLGNAAAQLLKYYKSIPESEEKTAVMHQLTRTMELRMDEASPNDFSMLGWLFLHLGDEVKAKNWGLHGLEKYPHNEHTQNLLKHLGIG